MAVEVVAPGLRSRAAQAVECLALAELRQAVVYLVAADQVAAPEQAAAEVAVYQLEHPVGGAAPVAAADL